MDELVDILDSEGHPTGKVLLKSEAHKKGLFHPTVHIWIYTEDGKILIQKRAANKKTYPNKWDVSVAGHITAGEHPLSSAIREIEEEIGLLVRENELEKIGIYRSSRVHSKDLIDCEFHHIYIVELKVPIEQLKIQENELAAIKLVNVDTYLSAMNNPSLLKDYVLFQSDYIELVFTAVQKKIKQ